MSTGTAVLLIALVSLATYRVTHLIAKDKFPPAAKFRQLVKNKFGADHWASYLVTCMWCVSVYTGGSIVLLTWLYADLPYPLLVWPVTSAVTGLIALREVPTPVVVRESNDNKARHTQFPVPQKGRPEFRSLDSNSGK